MAEREISWEELVQAGTVLFGPGFAAAARGPGWRDQLRVAWRRRVLETHPDRAAVLGKSEAQLQREFRAVTEAFALLESFAVRGTSVPPPRAGPVDAAPGRAWPPPPAPRGPAARPPHRPPPRPPSPPRAPPPPTVGSLDLAGPRLPRRRLRFAEFLYYSGRIGWQDYVAAVAWQRGQRPALGRLAVELGWLAQGEVSDLLERRRREGAQAEPIGQFAVRRGFLTRTQLLALVGRQNRGQLRIGQYFLQRALLTDDQLDGAHLALFGHNARFATRVA